MLHCFKLLSLFRSTWINFINSDMKLSYIMRIIFARVDLTFGPDENHFAHTNVLLRGNVGLDVDIALDACISNLYEVELLAEWETQN